MDNLEQSVNCLNDAINFALDELNSDEGITFLRMWREGDWQGIAEEFPEFDLSELIK